MGHNFKRILPVVLGITALAVLILYMGGFFATGLIGPQDSLQPQQESFSPEKTTKAKKAKITEWYEAVGTVSPRTKTRIEAQITARIESIQVTSGASVQKGDVIIILDERSLRSRLEQAGQGLKSARSQRAQARQGVNAAQAAFEEAQAAHERVKTYFEAQAATSQDLEEARSAFLQAKAGLQQAKDALAQARAGVNQAEKKVEEAEIALDYTQIKAPVSGEVAKRLADPGDLAMPGKPLLVLQTGKALRLEALVRENVIQIIKPGQKFQVVLEALQQSVQGTVEEVVPSADPSSRTFVVKVALPSTSGLFPGMFGRLQIPLGQKEVILAASKAVKSVGQLKMVKLKTEDGWKDVFVLTGKRLNDQLEILSGLNEGDTLALFGGSNE